jgi:hypothetical protein
MTLAGVIANPTDGFVDSSVADQEGEATSTSFANFGIYDMGADVRALAGPGGNYSYDCKTSPKYWARSGNALNDYSTCSKGKEQSPINIPVKSTLSFTDKTTPVEKVLRTNQMSSLSVGASLSLPCTANCGTLHWNNKNYAFKGIHLHGIDITLKVFSRRGFDSTTYCCCQSHQALPSTPSMA